MPLGRMVHVFTLNILAPLNNFSRLSPSINVTRVPMVDLQSGSRNFCFNANDEVKVYCCDHLHLNTLQSFAFPEEDFSIVISTPTFSEARLQMFRYLQANKGLAVPSSYNVSSLTERVSTPMASHVMFQVVKLLIGKLTYMY